MVRPRGFEPLTFCSGGKRSIQAELRARNQALVKRKLLSQSITERPGSNRRSDLKRRAGSTAVIQRAAPARPL
jgi:hypothetical protein